MKEKHKTNNLFPVQFAQDILLVLKQIDNKEENLKRVLSIKCFGDSKYFERNIEHILIRIIKTYLLEKAEEYSNDDILLEVGISKYPEIFLIADAKRGDIGNTSEMWRHEILHRR